MESVIQLVIFTVYVSYILLKYGQLKSISESYYYLRHWFTLFCYSIGIINFFRGEMLFFLSGVFLMFVGTATDFKQTYIIKIIHNIGAITSISLSLLGIYLYYQIWWAGLPILASFILLKKEYRIFWTEVVAFLSIILLLI